MGTVYELRHNGVQAWIEMDGEKVPIYVDGSIERLGWIESRLGEFSIGFRDGRVRQEGVVDVDTSVECLVDGFCADTALIEYNDPLYQTDVDDPSREFISTGEPISQTVELPYTFSATSFDSTLGDDDPEHGTIRVRAVSGRIKDQKSSKVGHQVFLRKDHGEDEKRLHQARPGPARERTDDPYTTYKFEKQKCSYGPNEVRAAELVFQYRPRFVLKNLGLIPSSPASSRGSSLEPNAKRGRSANEDSSNDEEQEPASVQLALRRMEAQRRKDEADRDLAELEVEEANTTRKRSRSGTKAVVGGLKGGSGDSKRAKGKGVER